MSVRIDRLGGKPSISRGTGSTATINISGGKQGPVGPPGGSDASFAGWVNDAASQTRAALSGAYASKLSTTDRIVYVSKAATASDANDGLSWGSAKATLQAAYDALPSTGGRIEAGYGTFALGSGSTGFQVTPGKALELRGVGRNMTEFTYSGSGVGIKIGDGRTVTDLATTNASATVTSASAAFTAADVGKVLFNDSGVIPADTTISSVTNSTTAVLSANATATTSGLTAQIATSFQDWGSLRDLQLTCSASSSQTGIKLTDAHRGHIDDVRILGNSYSAGSRGVWAINSFTNGYARPVIQNFESSIDLDGYCHNSSVDEAELGSKVVGVRVKNSTDVRLRGGQYSSTGVAAGGAGIKAICTYAASTDGGCDGLLIDQIHFESNNYGLDIAIGRDSDGSTQKVRSPIINAKLPSGGTIDRATNPTLLNLVIGFNGTWTVTANCTGLRYVGKISDNGASFTDSGVDSLRDIDFTAVRNGNRVDLNLLAFPQSFQAGDWSTLTNDSASFFGGYRTNNDGTPSQNDRVLYSTFLTKGTYALDLFYKRDTNGGQVQISVDGAAFLGTVVDMYAAAPAAAMVTINSIVISASGSHTFSFSVTNKNASSTGFVARLSHAVLRRTA